MEIHPFTHNFSTAYLVVSDGAAMLVDASYAQITPRVISMLERLGVSLDLIVLTHWHVDHIGAAEPLRDATGARVAIHRLDAESLRRGGAMHLKPTRLAGRVLARGFRGDQAPLRPDLALDDDEDLAVHGGVGRSFHTPGHTDGSLSVALPDGAVLAGDAISQRLMPFGAAAGPLFIEDPAAGANSIEVIARTATTSVRVAHVGEITLKSVRRLRR